ncbi:selenium binding protein [Listeria innocua]|uniref:selenium binding protein n=1 Tax=Enterococcus lactis TaxID=357441 RepID=UPI00237BD8D2|nr:selenium binding protein [Enterococcus lactis]EKD8217467.1 selenium binding protein [Listeria innocua]
MYEEYSKQALPDRKYRLLLGTALCVFNSNNSFIIENILRNDPSRRYNWHDLMDLTSGNLIEPVRQTIEQTSSSEIAEEFRQLKDKRDRIVHSFQVTSKDGSQILATKYKNGSQDNITEQFLLDFIDENGKLSQELHAIRGF